MTAYDRERSDMPAPAADLPAQDAHPLLEQFRAGFRDAPYYSTGRTWDDYAPAYRYGLDQHASAGNRAFEDVEAELQDRWSNRSATSRLAWAEARGAVEDAWHQAQALEAMPGLVPGGAIRSADAGVQQQQGEIDGGGQQQD